MFVNDYYLDYHRLELLNYLVGISLIKYFFHRFGS